MGTLSYIKNFLDDKNIGAITPTAERSVQKVCRQIDFPNTQLIVEYGPGEGVFTKFLLSQLPANATVIAIEANERMYTTLSRRISDPRLKIFQESAEHVESIIGPNNIGNVDYVISGIPFSFFSNELKSQIIGSTANILKTGGSFLVYQYFVPGAKAHGSLKSTLNDYFHRISLRHYFLNIPPLRVYSAVKMPAARA